MANALTTPVESPPVLTRNDVSVEEYHKLIDRGQLPEDGRFELLRGRIFPKMTKKPPHVFSTDETADLLANCVPADWYVRKQDPIALDDSEPEPDVVIAQGSKRTYSKRHPGPSDICLVVEVAQSSLNIDREKGSIYAAHLIPRYWIVNLAAKCIEAMSNPQGEGEEACYVDIEIYEPGASLPVFISDEKVGEIPVADVFD